MQSFPIRNLVLAATLLVASAVSARAQIIISEVHPSGSGNGTYGADWFELTNLGASAVDVTGWKVDDSSNSAGAALVFRGVTSIAAGQSLILIEGNASGSNDATVQTAFKSAWFGGHVPAGFAMGGYGGAGIGLSTAGDAVNIFNSTNTLITRVDFGAATTGVTFDNKAGLNNTTISQLSVTGINGAFPSFAGGETGSPGLIPEPSTYAALVGCVALGVVFLRRRERGAVPEPLASQI